MKINLISRLALSIGMVAMLALTSVLALSVFADTSAGRAAAINTAGSIRMQSARIALILADQIAQPDAPAVNALTDALNEMDRRIEGESLLRLADDPSSAAGRQYISLRTQWQSVVRPELSRPVGSVQQAAHQRALLSGLITQADQLTSTLEHSLEGGIGVLTLVQGTALFLIIGVLLVMLFLVQHQIRQAVLSLLSVTRAVGAGDFSARAQTGGQSEFAELANGFNSMVGELKAMRDQLEDRVREKTAALEHQNRTLNFLYETSRLLSTPPVDRSKLRKILQSLESLVGVRSAVVCARPDRSERGFVLASLDQVGHESDRCERGDCHDCHAELDTFDRLGGTRIMIPIQDAGRRYGALPVEVDDQSKLTSAHVDLLKVLGQHLGSAFAAGERQQEHARLAMLEERSVIARELHDSLAQALSYLKIQVSRIDALLNKGAPTYEVQPVVAELREGLSAAYRQLRELLSTFRLAVDGRGVGDALRRAAAETQARCGVRVDVKDELSGVELNATEQIHVVQIVREALANVEHHAAARHACVRLERLGASRIRVSVDDDGVGLDAQPVGGHHFGMSIMRDRARSLSGEIRIESRHPQGVRVTLEFNGSSSLTGATAEAATSSRREEISADVQ
ncbi:histidine kinase [Piscinibacterium candidicorallinum]|jgi:two-component system nitrate/nitrite sensor histidine kinase NarX|uniref:Sensor protein n=1 Tax=Piscinibacterium candidicorallinum TaxID=1793872 RepID=A0ABV7H969_9BURK